MTVTRSGLGFDPATIAAVYTTGRSLTGLFATNDKDPERFQKNAEAYQLAVAGNQNALEFLKYRSGRFGTASHLGPPYDTLGPIGGWATQAAKDDAWKLYQMALATFGIGEEEMPGGGGATSGAPGGFGLPPIRTMGTMDYTPLLVLGAGLAVYFATQKKGRRGRRS